MAILSEAFIRKRQLLKCMCKFKRISTRNAVGLVHKIHGPGLTKGSTPIIILHGLLGSKKNWDTMSKKIASATQKTVVTADARNHGESPHDESHTYQNQALDVSFLMRKLSIDNAIVIGHSMGGRTAMVLALTEASKVASLVIVDISPVSEAGLINNFFPRLFDLMKTIDFTGLDLGKARTLAKRQIMASGLVEHEELMNFIVMNVGTKHDKTIGWICNVDVLKSHFEVTIAKFPNLSGQKYEGPVLFIAGEESNFVHPGDFSGIKGYFPQAELKYVKGVGHNVHAEDPNTFLNMVTEFLTKNKL